MVRVQTQRDEGARLELRSPDSSANPYLVFALCLAAGLDGIEKNLQAPKELKENIRKLSREEKENAGIDTLPENLSEALEEFQKDPLMRAVLGDTFTKCYVKAKKKEWESYMEQVSEWEIEQYLYRV